MNVVDVFAHHQTGFALKKDGTVVGWGNDYLGFGDGLRKYKRSVTHSNKGLHAGAVLADGSVRNWGYGPWGQATYPGQFDDLVSICAGNTFTAGIRKDHSVVGWGDSEVQAGFTNVVAIRGTSDLWVAVHADGKLSWWGANVYAPDMGPITNAVSVGLDVTGIAVLLNNGEVRQFGGGPVPSSATNIASLVVANGHVMAVRNDTLSIAWGSAPDFTTFFYLRPGYSSVAAGFYYLMGLTTNGTIDAISTRVLGGIEDPTVRGLSNIVAISAREFNRGALRADGTMYLWTLNSLPAEFPLKNVMAIDCGLDYVAAIVRQVKPVKVRTLGFDNAGAFFVRIEGDVGTKFILEATSDGEMKWRSVVTGVLTEATTVVIDPASAAEAVRLYRVISE